MALFIFSGGVGLISLEVITLTAYLRSWALVTPIVVSRFLLDSHMLLEAIGVNNLGPLPFQLHMRSTQEFFPLGATTCFPPFEQLVERKIDCLQEKYFRKIT
jgi:hypothetical protein